MDPDLFVFHLAVLLAGHVAGDVLAQPHRLAVLKGEPGPEGAAACRAHVVSYLAVQGFLWAVLIALAGIEVHPVAGLAMLAWSGLTHYFLDRGPLLRAIAAATGSTAYVRTRQGRMAYDQACHGLVLVLAAVLLSS